MESDKSRETARIAMREVEVVRQELQEEREHARRLKENFRRDVIIAESRTVIAEVVTDILIILLVDSKLIIVYLKNF